MKFKALYDWALGTQCFNTYPFTREHFPQPILLLPLTPTYQCFMDKYNTSFGYFNSFILVIH